MKLLETFIRSSQRMKLIWHDAEGQDEDVQEDDLDQYSDEEDDGDELEEVASHVPNQVLQD